LEKGEKTGNNGSRPERTIGKVRPARLTCYRGRRRVRGGLGENGSKKHGASFRYICHKEKRGGGNRAWLSAERGRVPDAGEGHEV